MRCGLIEAAYVPGPMADRIHEIARLRTVEFLVREARRLADGEEAICAKLEAALGLILAQLVDDKTIELRASQDRSDPDLI